ncbi:FecR family protein [Xylophilus rhododendri]|nr:FecR family protein [Xylophilus rhododendri]
MPPFHKRALKRPAAFAALLALGLALHAGGSQAAEETLRAGTAKLVKGQVQVANDAGERALQPGDGVSAADRVLTGPDGSASLVLRDGTMIVVGPNSRMDLREFTFDSTTYKGNLVVRVVRGTMRMVSGLIRKTRPEAVSIETPTALIGIRGTDFIVEVEPTEEAAK